MAKTIEDKILKPVRKDYAQRLAAAGIPEDPAQQTAEQQGEAQLIWLAAMLPLQGLGVITFADFLGQKGNAVTTAPAVHPHQAAPINFTIAPAQRSSGSFSSSNVIYPGGHSNLTFSLTGLGSGAGSDYENPANSFDAKFLFDPTGGTNFQVYDEFTWQGGLTVIKGVTDPTPTGSIPLTNLPAGSNVNVTVTLTGTMTIGLTGSIN